MYEFIVFCCDYFRRSCSHVGGVALLNTEDFPTINVSKTATNSSENYVLEKEQTTETVSFTFFGLNVVVVVLPVNNIKGSGMTK